MDDKYRKEYLKQREQFKNYSEHQWEPKSAYQYEKEKEEWHREQNKLTGPKKRTKPDPATVEAELQLEEKLWAS